MLASHHCDLCLIPVLAILGGLSMLLVLILLRGFFSGFLPPQKKPTLQFDLDIEQGHKSMAIPCLNKVFVIIPLLFLCVA